MAGFRKARAEQAFVKAGMYGPQGSGKTATALLCAEGLAQHYGKRVAFIDTEHGTDFYVQTVPERKFHPEAFDIDAMYGRSITDAISAIKELDTNVYGVVVIDSISHIWDAAIAMYKGKQTSIGTIPMSAWAQIKKPYKELMTLLLSMPAHVIICGRQANVFEDEDGEMKKTGVKMRAEGETEYEPHICIRFLPNKPTPKGDSSDTVCIVEKDRTSILHGKMIVNPTYDKLIKPIVKLLGGTQATIETEDETGRRDAEAMAIIEQAKEKESLKLFTTIKASLDIASTKGNAELKAASELITTDVKKRMTSQHVTMLRDHYMTLIGNKPDKKEE